MTKKNRKTFPTFKKIWQFLTSFIHFDNFNFESILDTIANSDTKSERPKDTSRADTDFLINTENSTLSIIVPIRFMDFMPKELEYPNILIENWLENDIKPNFIIMAYFLANEFVLIVEFIISNRSKSPLIHFFFSWIIK